MWSLGRHADFLYDTINTYVKDAQNANWSDLVEMWNTMQETSNSLKTRLSKLRYVLNEQGFEIYSDEEMGDFTFIEARKK